MVKKSKKDHRDGNSISQFYLGESLIGGKKIVAN